MKEQFDKRLLTGEFTIACKYEGSPTRYWKGTKEEVIARIISIVTQYTNMGYRLTLRQLHYQFVSRNWIVNHAKAYKKLGEVLDDCRYAGLVDWNAIVDRGRNPYLPHSVNGITDALNDTHDQYRLDRQQGQDTYIEVWTEKDALSEIMQRSTSKYHVTLCVNKGYTSSSAVYESYERFAERIQNGQEVVVLYFGDHDPSGLDMIRDIDNRLTTMLANGRHNIVDGFRVVPIGLTMDQIKEYKCPPNPTKMTDSRTEDYVKMYGRTCWEVDALPPEALTNIIESSIESLIDMNWYQKKLDDEETDKGKLRSFINDNDDDRIFNEWLSSLE